MNSISQIPNCRNYFASTKGDIFSIIKFKYGERKRVLKLRKDKRGYLRAKVNLNGKSVWYAVHRLVAFTYIPNPLNKDQVNHKDGNKLNNNVENLEWCNCAENIKHAWLNKLNVALKGNEANNRKLNENQVYAIRLIYSLEFMTAEELSILFNVHKSTIHSIIKNKNWKL